MVHGFTVYVLLTATAAFFLDELTATAKKVWANHFLRHFCLMFFIAFFIFPYQVYVKAVLVHGLHYVGLIIVWFNQSLPSFPAKQLISASLSHIFVSIIVTAVFGAIYFIARRKLYPHLMNFMWIVWLVLASMYVTASFTFSPQSYSI